MSKASDCCGARAWSSPAPKWARLAWPFMPFPLPKKAGLLLTLYSAATSSPEEMQPCQHFPCDMSFFFSPASPAALFKTVKYSPASPLHPPPDAKQTPQTITQAPFPSHVLQKRLGNKFLATACFYREPSELDLITEAAFHTASKWTHKLCSASNSSFPQPARPAPLRRVPGFTGLGGGKLRHQPKPHLQAFSTGKANAVESC